MDANVSTWRDKHFALLEQVPLPAQFSTWDNFQDEFVAQLTDPHEAEKPLDKIQRGVVFQRTSVKFYNDHLNELLRLTGLAGDNPAILRSYVVGLKSAVRIAAFPLLRAQPDITFPARQTLMAEIDDELMYIHAEQSTAPPPRRTPQVVFNMQNPLQNPTPIAATPGERAGSTPAPRESTPSKVEATRRYTRLTPEERDNLRRIGGCFRCRQPGHMASQYPRVV